jgi:2-desacetyl-2-hydroxyethyl bacteriochlorophyllide A dehydrogenase
MPRELIVTAPRTVAIVEREDAPLEPGQLRARALVSGISHGTELQLWRGSSAFRGSRFDTDLRLFVPDESGDSYPLRLGYEWVGVVEEGDGLAAGTMVHLPRPHAETHVFAAGDAFVVPDDLSAERAAMLQSATIALQAVHDASLKLGDRVAIFGLGTFGLLAVQLARLSGAGWIAASDPLPERRARGESLGADHLLDPSAVDAGLELRLLDGVGVDVAIEFSGSHAGLDAAMRSVRVGGAVVAAGFYSGGELLLGREFHHNRLSLVASQGGWGLPPRDERWPRARGRRVVAELLASGRLRADELVTHRIPFAEASSAYELAEERPADVLRMLLVYQELPSPSGQPAPRVAP